MVGWKPKRLLIIDMAEDYWDMDLHTSKGDAQPAEREQYLVIRRLAAT
jgi:hypothetical protein